MHFVAEQLGVTLGEVEGMSPHEFAGWIAYFKIKAQETKAAQAKARSASKRPGARKPW